MHKFQHQRRIHADARSLRAYIILFLYASYLSLVIVHAERDADVIFSRSKVSSTGPFFSDDNWDRWSNREVLLNKLKEPPRELSPDTFHHEVQHMEPDGTRTTYVYTATKSSHLRHLEAGDVLSVRCVDSLVVEVTVTDPEVVRGWNASSDHANATILSGGVELGCVDEEGKPIEVLHRVSQLPTRPSVTGDLNYSFALTTEKANFMDAFEKLHLKFYRGKKSAEWAKDRLRKNGTFESTNEGVSASSRGFDERKGTQELSKSGSGEDVVNLGAREPFHSDSDLRRTLASDTYDSLGTFEALLNIHQSPSSATSRRKLLVSYSCSDQSCPSGQYRNAWQYGNSCCDDWGGTCGWGYTTVYRPDCRSCHSNCKTCSGGGSDDCESCDADGSRPAHKSGYLYGGYCYECTSDAWCAQGEYCSSNTCSSCHSNCKTCSGGGSDYCESCHQDGAKPYFVDGLLTGGYCHECTSDIHCGDGMTCSGFECTIPECSGFKHCAACEPCILCNGGNSCTSCVAGSAHPHLVWKVFGYECKQCGDDSHCPEGYECSNDECVPGPSMTCLDAMPDPSTRQTVDSKHVVHLKSIIIKQHASESLGGGAPDYYSWSKTDLGEETRQELPCLAYWAEDDVYPDLDAEVASVSCGQSFRFGIWEDDSTAYGTGWLFDTAYGEKWFSTLDFSSSASYTYNSNVITFVLECRGCHEACTKENSMATRVFPSDPTYGYTPADSHFPITIWGDDSLTNVLASFGGMALSCSNCHLEITDAGFYEDIELDVNAGFRELSVWADVQTLLTLNFIFGPDEDNSGISSERELVSPFGIPPLFVPGRIGIGSDRSVGIDIGLRGQLLLVTGLESEIVGSADYSTGITGRSEFGFIYDLDSGIKFLSNSHVENRLVEFHNDIEGTVTSSVAFRPCFQVGFWANLSFVDGHAFAEACGDIFARTSLEYAASGFTPGNPVGVKYSQARVKLDERFDIFKPCDTETLHDSRIFVDVGINNPTLSAEWFADARWKGMDLKSLVWEEKYGPWKITEDELSFPAASGCMCLLSCGNQTTSAADPVAGSTSGSVTSAGPPPGLTEPDDPVTTDVLEPSPPVSTDVDESE